MANGPLPVMDAASEAMAVSKGLLKVPMPVAAFNVTIPLGLVEVISLAELPASRILPLRLVMEMALLLALLD